MLRKFAANHSGLQGMTKAGICRAKHIQAFVAYFQLMNRQALLVTRCGLGEFYMTSRDMANTP
jgi:hypothetical protein